MEKIQNFRKNILDFLYKYRFIIAALLIVLAVIFKLHGSSISLWKTIFSIEIEDNSLILGNPQFIRSDEWAVTTPFIISQSHNRFNIISNIIRGSATEVFTLYGLPVLNIVELFRPFHLGYLFLGISRGLSFFWAARFIILFLISFEFFMLLTEKSKRLSVISSFVISLSPIIQWWFATNGLVEIFIYGMLALILLYKYLTDNNFKHRLLYLFGMMICAGGYIWVLYPPFQIPMFFVYLSLAVYLIIKYRKECKINLKDILSIVVMLLIFVSLNTYIFITAKDTISTTMNTVYPGSRIETGGRAYRKYLTYLDDIIFAFKGNGTKRPLPEESALFTLFPMGLILSIAYIIKNKKVDPISIALYIPYVFIGLYSMIGFPEWLVKITLLSYSSSARSVLAIEFIDIMLLFRTLAIDKKPLKIWLAILLSFALSIGMVFITKTLDYTYVGRLIALVLFIVSFYLFYFAIRFNSKYGKYFFTLGMIPIMILAGFFVNPISSGIDAIENSPLLKAVSEINEKDSGLWIAEAMPFPCPNYLVMAGAETINSTNEYPNLELMNKLDPENKYEDIYNRYAHIYIELVKDKAQEKFVLLTPDIYNLYITTEDLKAMNIKYIFTVRVMEDYKDDHTSFDLIYNENNYHIYKVTYK